MAENGWFPRFNLLGEVATGFGRVEFQGRVLLQPGFAPRWYNDDILICGGEGDYLYWVSKHGGEVYRVQANGQDVKPPFQLYGAGGGQWSITTEGESPEGHWREIGVEHDIATGARLTLREYRGENANRSVWYGDRPLSEHRFLAGARAFGGYVVWVELARPYVIRGWRGNGVEDLASHPLNSDGEVLSEGNPIPILTDEGPWFSFATSIDIRVRSWDSRQGYIIPLGNDKNLNHDAIGLGRTIRLTWQDNQGNRTQRDISLDEPRVDVGSSAAPPPPPPAYSEPEPRSEMQRTGTIVDVLDYLIGAPQLWPRYDHERRNEMNQILYLNRDAIRFAKFGKANSHETWTWDREFVYHWEDNSHEGYHFTDGRWMRRRWRIGEWLVVENNERVVYNDDCTIKKREPYPYRTMIEGYWPRYWCGPDLGERPVISFIYDPTMGRTNHPDLHWERDPMAKGAGWFEWNYINAQSGATVARNQFFLIGGPNVAVREGCRGLPPIVDNPEEPMPIPSLLQIVQETWTKYGGASADAANEIAWRGNGNKADGPWGVSYLSAGQPQPRTGKRISWSVIHYSTDPAASREDGTIGTLFRVFDDGPVWFELTSHGDPDRNWLPPVEPLDAPPPPPTGTLEQRVAALEARVTALEGGTTPEPDPDPPDGDEATAPNAKWAVEQAMREHPELNTQDEHEGGRIVDFACILAGDPRWGRKARNEDGSNKNRDGMCWLRSSETRRFEIYDVILGFDPGGDDPARFASWGFAGVFDPGENGWWAPHE